MRGSTLTCATIVTVMVARAFLLAALIVAGQAVQDNDTALLFFDGHRLASWSRLQLSVGTAHLLSEFRDPTSFVGWGYPSTWRKEDGAWRTMYQGWHLKGGKEDTKLGLLADSADAVNWAPAKLANPVFNVSNCVLHNAGNEFSVVYDDSEHAASPADRLKCLWSGNKITASGDDGATWHQFGEWTSEPIDPGVSVFRSPADPSLVVVTARPQGLRHTDGRHAGYHSGLGWAGLAKDVNRRALPLDDVFTKTDEPYGLPSFSYHGQVVSWFWRYSCPAYPCFSGGNVSSALAYSYNAQNWTAFGQFFPFPSSSPPSAGVVAEGGGPAVGRGPLNNTDISSAAYGHTYTVFQNKTAGALSCQSGCDADSKCAAWTYVRGGECCGRERCCRHAALGCPKTADRVGCVSGAKKPAPCDSPPPPPPPAPAEVLPQIFSNVGPAAGQIYPNTLIEMPGQGSTLTILDLHQSSQQS